MPLGTSQENDVDLMYFNLQLSENGHQRRLRVLRKTNLTATLAADCASCG